MQELNPLVQVKSEARALDALPDDFFRQFTVICVVAADKEAEVRALRSTWVNAPSLTLFP